MIGRQITWSARATADLIMKTRQGIHGEGTGRKAWSWVYGGNPIPRDSLDDATAVKTTGESRIPRVKSMNCRNMFRSSERRGIIACVIGASDDKRRPKGREIHNMRYRVSLVGPRKGEGRTDMESGERWVDIGGCMTPTWLEIGGA